MNLNLYEYTYKYIHPFMYYICIYAMYNMCTICVYNMCIYTIHCIYTYIKQKADNISINIYVYIGKQYTYAQFLKAFSYG